MSETSTSRRVLLASLTAVFSAGMYLVVPKLSPYAREIGSDYAIIGFINGAYGLSQMLIRIPLGILSDCVGRRKGLIFAGFVMTLLSGLLAWAIPSPLTLVLMRMLQGGSAATYLAYSVIYSSYFDKAHTSRAVGTITALFTMGQILALIAAGFLTPLLGYPFLFPITAAIAFTGLLLTIPVQETPLPQHDKVPFCKLFLMFLHGPLLRVSLLGILTQIVTFGAVFGFVPLTAKELGANDPTLSILATLGMLPGVFLPWLSARLVKNGMNPRFLVSAGFLISALFCLAVPFAGNLATLYGLQFFGGFGRGLIFPLLMGSVIQDIPENRRGTVMGMYQSFYGIGMFAGPVIFGYIAKNSGLSHAYLAGTAASALGVFLAFILPVPQKKNLSQKPS